MHSKRFLEVLSVVFFAYIAAYSHAQEVDLLRIKDELNAVSMRLEEKLGFREGAALFGLNRGTVNAVYLYGQGVLLEIRTPLANERNRLQLASLHSTMQTLQNENPFEQFLLQNSVSEDFSRADDENVSSFYQGVLGRIETIDSTLSFSRAIQQAQDSVRLLRALENIDDAGYEELRAELQGLKSDMDKNTSALAQLEEEMQVWFGAEIEFPREKNDESNAPERDFDHRLSTLIETIEPLKELAVEKAEQLKERAQIAKQDHITKWEGSVLEFEMSLYKYVCDSRLFLQSVPLDENVTFLLKGLGEESESLAGHSDKLHVLTNLDVKECQTANIDPSELLDLAHQYSL